MIQVKSVKRLEMQNIILEKNETQKQWDTIKSIGVFNSQISLWSI